MTKGQSDKRLTDIRPIGQKANTIKSQVPRNAVNPKENASACL